MGAAHLRGPSEVGPIQGEGVTCASVGYASQGEVARAMARIARKDGRVFHCVTCGKWHVARLTKSMRRLSHLQLSARMGCGRSQL